MTTNYYQLLEVKLLGGVSYKIHYSYTSKDIRGIYIKKEYRGIPLIWVKTSENTIVLA